MLQELGSVKEKYDKLTALLSDPDIVSDQSKVKNLSKERAELEPIVKTYISLLKINKSIKGSREIIDDPDAEEELKELAEEELQELEKELEKIKKDYRGILDVMVIDVWKNPDAATKYNIRLIPTQIFYDATGKELTRHEGFMGKKDILETFKRFGIKLENI